MKTLHYSIILILFASLVIPTLQNVIAIPYMSPQDLYKQSDMVFYGQVISKQTGPGPDYYYYQVKVETYFKNPQISDSITVTGHKSSDTHMAYPQFEVGDKAIFYTSKLEGINTISPFSTKAGEACDIHAFLGPAPIQGEPIARNPGVPLTLLDENGSMVGSSLTNHPVFLTYDIVNNYPFSKNFTLEAFVKDQNDTSITFYKKQVLELGACESTGDALKWSFVPTKSGTYSLNVNIDGQFRLGYGFQVTDAHSANNPNSQVVSSPLQQFRSGIVATDVTCRQELQLIFKTEGNSPACVKADTAFHLSVFGWGYLPDPFITKMDLLDSKITGGKITEFQYSPQYANIIIKIQTTSNGTLTVIIPKVVTDLSPYYLFKTYEVLDDGKEVVDVGKITTAKGPSFTIPFTKGTNEIEIMGIQVGQMTSK